MLFRRKKKPEIIEPPPCKHKWQDFPWYCTYSTSYGELDVTIKEPYVCIYCKERKDVVLLHNHYSRATQQEIQRKLTEVRNAYRDHLEDMAIVEDQIHDFQLVDRQWLEIAKALREGQDATK